MIYQMSGFRVILSLESSSAGLAIQTFDIDLVKLKGPLFLYMGQEYGVNHRPNLFEKDPVDWKPNTNVLEIYKEAIKIKKRQ